MIDRVTTSRPMLHAALVALIACAIASCKRDIEQPRIGAAAMASELHAPELKAPRAVQALDTATAAPPPAVAVENGGDTVHAVAGDAAAGEKVLPATARLSAPVTFSLTATALNKTLHLRSEDQSGAIGFLCTSAGAQDAPSASGRKNDPTMKISRFAQYGHTDTLFLFQWVVSMDDDQGSLAGRRTVKDGRKGYEVTLTGKLNLQVLMKSATQPLRMHSREDAVLKGFSPSWPPYGAMLSLENGPLDFFLEKRGTDTVPHRMVVVDDAQATLGKGPSSYFEATPRITKAVVIDRGGAQWRSGDVGGVRLEWASAGASRSATIAGYNIYRSMPGSATWQRIATVPASQMTFTDNEFDGRAAASYMIAQRADFPIKYEYEGMNTSPILVKAVRQ